MASYSQSHELEDGGTLIQVYTGCGKGKTTAALGLALRASGAGLKIYIAQFAKGKVCSELNALKKIKNIKVRQFGSCRFIKKITPKDIELAKRGLEATKKAIRSKKFNVVILDEINVALGLKLLELKEVLKVIKKTPQNLELILTGRHAPAEILEIADLVSEIKEIKHYFQKGIKGRRGIEF